MKTTIKVQDNFIIVGKKQYAVEKALVKKLERTVKGVTQENPKEDAVGINEGKEGKGKTNASVVEAAYLKARLGREVHLFFRLEPMMEFAMKTYRQIIIWDEPALDSLSRDQLNKRNVDMQRFFMTIRKRQHIFLINYTKFWKFPEYIVVDRANFLLHFRDKPIGRFFFVRQKNLEYLWNEYRTKHKRVYVRASSFGGAMPDFMRKEFSNLGFWVNDIKDATLEDYESEKDNATHSIGKNEDSKKVDKTELRNFKATLASIDFKQINSKRQLAMAMGIPYQSVKDWAANGVPSPTSRVVAK